MEFNSNSGWINLILSITLYKDWLTFSSVKPLPFPFRQWACHSCGAFNATRFINFQKIESLNRSALGFFCRISFDFYSESHVSDLKSYF